MNSTTTQELRDFSLGTLSKEGNPFFLVLSGSHAYGTFTDSSDYDIQGVYVNPTEKLLGLKNPNDNIRHESPGGKIDLAVDELGKYLRLVSKGDSHRTCWTNYPVIWSSSEFGNLRNLVNGGISKAFGRRLLKFGQDFYKKGDQENLKKDLYMLRSFMIGIHAMQGGAILPSLDKLNDVFRFPLVDELIEQRREGVEERNPALTRGVIGLGVKLENRLVDAIESATLPETPDLRKIENYLVELRRKNL